MEPASHCTGVDGHGSAGRLGRSRESTCESGHCGAFWKGEGSDCVLGSCPGQGCISAKSELPFEVIGWCDFCPSPIFCWTDGLQDLPGLLMTLVTLYYLA